MLAGYCGENMAESSNGATITSLSEKTLKMRIEHDLIFHFLFASRTFPGSGPIGDMGGLLIVLEPEPRGGVRFLAGGGGVVFEAPDFIGGVLFEEAVFTGGVRFESADFLGGVFFDGPACIGGMLDYKRDNGRGRCGCAALCG